jgi:pimeloyl-ACP methyl ester carboxylesterase
MREVIDGRSLIVLDDLDVVIRGTHHRGHGNNIGSQLGPISKGCIGIVFLNGMYVTRAGNGDAAVYWADSFAKRGYPSFRIDFPGLGDSEGNPPTDWLGFVNRGGYASITSAAIAELTAQFQLSGVVIAGHCAGAVSAIYAAAITRECKGLVLMDPYFHLPQAEIPKIRKELNLWARRSRLGEILSRLFDFLKQMRLLLRRNGAPDNANFSLLRCWKELSSAGLPILILRAPGRRAPGTKARTGEFDYLKHAVELAGQKGRIVVRVMDGANHSFSNYAGRVAVRQHTENWLNAFYPLTDSEENAAIGAHLESDDINDGLERRKHWLYE